MSNFLHSFLFLFLFTSITQAQINNRIKENSDRNAENRDRERNRISYNNSDNGFYEEDDSEINWFSSESSDLEGCGCCGFNSLFYGLADLNQNIIAKEAEISRINSVDLGLSLGHITQNSTSFIPRIRINGGLLSTDFRIFTNIEEHIDGQDSYTTIDWQMLLLNLIVEPEANFRIGSGIMFEEYSGIFFNEHTASLDFYFDRVKWNLEGRYAPDYKTKITARSEFNTSLHYLFSQNDEFLFSGFVKFLATKYYEDVNFNAFYVGVEFNFGY